VCFVGSCMVFGCFVWFFFFFFFGCVFGCGLGLWLCVWWVFVFWWFCLFVFGGGGFVVFLLFERSSSGDSVVDTCFSANQSSSKLDAIKSL